MIKPVVILLLDANGNAKHGIGFGNALLNIWLISSASAFVRIVHCVIYAEM